MLMWPLGERGAVPLQKVSTEFCGEWVCHWQAGSRKEELIK
jgi:hypothetical protein